MTGRDLAGTIVRRYAESYRRSRVEVTQSAIDLSKLEPLVEAVDWLAGGALQPAPQPRRRRGGVRGVAAVAAVLRQLLRRPASLRGNLAAATDFAPVRAACDNVQRAIVGDHVEGPIIAASHGGARMARARGLSIHFPPFRDPSAFYRDMDFARRTRWAGFLEAYLGNGRKGQAR